MGMRHESPVWLHFEVEVLLVVMKVASYLLFVAGPEDETYCTYHYASVTITDTFSVDRFY